MEPRQSICFSRVVIALAIVVVVPVVGTLAMRLGREGTMSDHMDGIVNRGTMIGDIKMASQTTSPLRVGQVLEIRFPTFTPRITIHSERKLTVEIVAGENVGFSDTVEYEAVAVRDDLVMLSWREQIGSTIVHVLDLASGESYAAVTPAKGGFMRLKGRIEFKRAG
jgi:molybdenum cofactor biosynthesis MoaF-like protein